MGIKTTMLLVLLLSGQVMATDIVKIATGAGDYFGPWHHNDDAGKLEGYDIDVGRAACELAGLECEFYTQEFASIIQSIRFNKYDVIMSGLTNNQYRRRVVDFSGSYARSATFVITNDATEVGKDFCKNCPEVIDVENPEAYEAFLAEMKRVFKGKTVAVQRGTVSHDFFNEQPELLKIVKIKECSSRSEVLEVVAKNEADIGFGPDWVEDYNKENNTQMRVYDFTMSGGNFGRGVGIAVRKKDTELKQKLSDAIEQLKKSGKLSELAIKWFGDDVAPK